MQTFQFCSTTPALTSLHSKVSKMNALMKPCNKCNYQSSSYRRRNHPSPQPRQHKNPSSHCSFAFTSNVIQQRKLTVRATSSGTTEGGGGGGKRKSFLTLEEAGLVEISGLSAHERFLCRLTISSLNLLRVVAEEEGCEIEELNAGRICDWFMKDKLRREQTPDSAVLQWDDSDFQF